MFFTYTTKAFCSPRFLPGNACQIMKGLIEETGTTLPQRNDQFTKVRIKIRQ